MASARHLISLLRSHAQGDDGEFYATAMQLAADQARQGHQRVADEIRLLIDEAKARQRQGEVLVMRERPDLAGLVSVSTPQVLLSSMVLSRPLRERLQRVIQEFRQSVLLRERGLFPRRRLLFVGPPGTGKTMGANALAGELHMPLLTVLLEGVITKFMGETAAKLRLIFEAMQGTAGIYLFDEFDAIGARRDQRNDVGEIRRVLNSFLQLMDADVSTGPIVAATNHPELLDPALFRRFDDVIEFKLPTTQEASEIIRNRLAQFGASNLNLPELSTAAAGLSQSEIARACDEAAKRSVLAGLDGAQPNDLLAALAERRNAFTSTRKQGVDA